LALTLAMSAPTSAPASSSTPSPSGGWTTIALPDGALD
jgi:hypothetical protein